MMWAYFLWHGLSPLTRINGHVNSEKYIQEIFDFHLVLFLEKFEEKYGTYLF